MDLEAITLWIAALVELSTGSVVRGGGEGGRGVGDVGEEDDEGEEEGYDRGEEEEVIKVFD